MGMIKKKIIASVCLVSTGFLASAEKKPVRDYESFTIVSPEQQLACMIKKGFTDINARLEELDRRMGSSLDKLNERVDEMEDSFNVLNLFQPDDQSLLMGRMSAIVTALRHCVKATAGSKEKKLEGFVFIGRDIERFLDLFEKDALCFSFSSQHKEVVGNILSTVFIQVEERLALLATADDMKDSDKVSKEEILNGYLHKLENIQTRLKGAAE
jgi:hypothetical protein